MMRLTIAATLALLVGAAVAQAETPASIRFRTEVEPAPEVALSPGEITATPEMWFYEQQLRQYRDPNHAVRRKAEFRAEQRQRRLAAMKWFGLSNARPQASTDPVHADYSPAWVSNQTAFPYRWQGAGPATVIVK